MKKTLGNHNENKKDFFCIIWVNLILAFFILVMEGSVNTGILLTLALYIMPHTDVGDDTH